MKLFSGTRLMFTQFLLVATVFYVPNVTAADLGMSLDLEKAININILSVGWRQSPRVVGHKHRDLFMLSETGVLIHGDETRRPYPGLLNPSVFRAVIDNTTDISLNVGNPANYVFSGSELRADSQTRVLSEDRAVVQTAVPLPAAIWLFGSAIVGFVMFSARRKV